MNFIIQEIKNQNKISSIKFIINSIENPLTLYLLELTEVEFQKISEEQKILINFENLANYILNLLNLCKKNINHSAHIFVNESPEVIFLIEEKIKQKINENIKIIFRKANDEEIKNYMNKIYLELRQNFSEIYTILNEQNIKIDKLNKENALLSENIKIVENEKNETINKLMNEKNKEINEIKDNYIKEDKTKFENNEIEKKNLVEKYENKISELENKIKILSQNSHNLEESNNKNNILKNDLEEKYKSMTLELDTIKNENNKIKTENDQLNKQNMNIIKSNEELKSMNNILKQEIEESQKNNFDMNIVIDNLKKQLNSNEMNIKSLNNQNLNLNEKMEILKNEIIKGNSIIEKLELDLKNKKSKLKAIKQTVDTQEQLIKQKENKILIQDKALDDIFLNKNITDITAAPFEARTQKQDEFINKYNDNISGSGTLFQEHDNSIDYKYKTFNTDLQNNNNYLEDDLLALPETNLCNYKLSGQLGGTMDKYITKKNFYNTDNLNGIYGEYYYDNNSILKYKYGNNDKNLNYEEAKYNIMEEYQENNKTNKLKISENSEI